MAKYFNKNKLAQLTGILLTGALLSPLANAGELSGEVGVANDYRFRGVSQTAGEFQVSGGIDYSMESGFFVGAWASNVDFDGCSTYSDNSEDCTEAGDEVDASFELDVYAGYYHEVNENLSWDVTLYRYNYPGDNLDADYFEVTFGFDFQGVRTAYWFTNDYYGSGLDYNYLEVNYSWEFVENWSLDLHGGYNSGEAVDEWMGAYTDYSIGVSTEVFGVGLSLAWLDSTINEEFAVKDGVSKTEGTVLASVSYAF
ncbi:TorF family putative porin [Shewanella sp. JM162201]|uniref:TorF family putative porin n=1 Tax=Shewanella jiangmenensis TaxID=2837387 RepID=A0ABS5V2C4_9GAMM|nr:TorF family putative porin [Shewanella jiangmenensis]